jgi:hypothetical protein
MNIWNIEKRTAHGWFLGNFMPYLFLSKIVWFVFRKKEWKGEFQ